jgi:ligand-binding sensor domain-containing protein
MRLNLTALSRIGLILVCTLSSGVSTQAQLSPRLKQLRNITFDHVTSEQGLPSDVVTAIIEDSRGFMWFGTQNGLCRYDGYSMVIYKRNELDSTSISDNFVNRILEDADKRTIWVGTNNGLNAYDISTGKFTRFTPDSATPYSLTSPMVNGICQDHTGRLWVGTVKELSEIVVDSSGQVKVVQYMNFPKDTTSQSRDYIDEPREGDDGMIWFATRGLVRFDPETKQFTRFLFSAEGAPTPSVNRIIAIEKDRKGNFWAGTYHGVIRFDTRTTSFEQIGYDPANPHSLSRNEVKSLRIDESGTLWVGTAGSGLYALDTATGQQIRFSHNPPRPGGLSNDFLDGLCRDRRGSLWVATSGGGINKYDKDRNQCIHIRNEPGNRNSLTDDNVFEMVEDNRGAVWIATSAGLNVYDPRTGNFNHYLHNPSNERSLSDPFVSSLYKDSDGTIWAGTYEGLNRIDPLTGIVTRYYNEPAPPHHSPMNKITAIHRDRSGTLWVATMNGPKTVNLKEKRFEGYLYYEWILQILGDRDGKSLWVGTKRAGLLKIDSKTRIVKQFSYDPHNPTSISHNSVCTLCEDPKEPQRILWIATLGGGLNRFDKSAGTFTRFTETDGLADNHIHSMAFDRRGNLWLGTGKGLSRFDPKTGVFKNYDARDGITNGEANHHGLLRASTGELYVGTPKGITIFHPDSLRDNPHIPPIVLTDFRITNKSVVPGAPHSPLSRTITETKEITLSYLDNMISIDFAALDFVMPGKNQYAYKLEGFDKDWIRSGNVHTATFTNLDPGKYTFRVKGSNNDGLWNEEGTSLSITITPPWWKATWAYFAYVVILGSVLYSAYRVRVNRLRLVHKLELQHLETTKMREVDELKSRFFTNISHEFRTPLTLILGPAKQLLEGSTDEVTKTKADLIHRSAGKLNRLVDELLDLARIEAGEMKLIARPINIVSAVHDLVLTYQSLAERKKIAFRCSCDQHEIVAYLDKNKAEKILTNVLSNAFKFTPEGGTVEVRITSGTSHRNWHSQGPARQDLR